MALQFGVNEKDKQTLALAVEASPVSWWRDLAAHGQLKAELDGAFRRQIHLMEIIRTGADVQPCKAAIGPVSPSWAPHTRVGTSASPQRRVSVQAAHEELDALDRQMDDLREQMRGLETTILTRDPETASETAAMLRFVSELLMAGAQLDADYLADVLDTCAEACGPIRVPMLSARN